MYDPAPKFGRLFAPDIRDGNHLVRQINPMAAVEAANITNRYHALAKKRFRNQEETTACTGTAIRHYLDAGPIQNLGGPDWMEFYRLNQLNDEWDGEEPAYYGSSVRASFKVAKKLGFIKSYAWAYDLETAINHILTESGLVAGTSWFTGMMRTDKDGFIHADGRLVGGHAYFIRGCNREKRCPDGSLGAVRGVQSWGLDWGDGGQFWLSFKDFDALIRDQGECAVAYEAKAPATP